MVRRPLRGDVFWVELDPVCGSEQGGTRPAVVVQNDVGNRFAPTTVIATISTKIIGKAYPFVVTLPDETLPRPSAVDCAHVRTIDLSRLGDRIAHLDADVMRRVDDALKASLGLM